MPTPTYIALATVTLTGSASSVTFGSIPQNYRDLVMVVDGSGTGNLEMHTRYNSDSGSNYPYVGMDGTYSEVGTAVSATNFGYFTTARWFHTIQIFDYSTTNKHKMTLLRRNGPTSNSVAAESNRWANNAAINSISITASANAFATGTTFNLYGIAG
jgi:hypothetical protein